MAGRSGSFGPVTGPVVLAAGLLWYRLCVRWWTQVGDKLLEELDRGYVTLVIDRGVPPNSTTTGRGASRVLWDLSAVWVLTPDGTQVLSPPVAGGQPPGFYPSPHRPGSEELWTGVAWAGIFRNSAASPLS